ncbi:MAG: DNA helicase RecG, partial [Desulfitobacterium hafniense]
MIGNQGKIVLNHLQRAIAAEEKQGCCNTGVIGGFHLFLKGILSRLEQLEKDEDFKVLKDITGHYKDWSPLQRRQALAHLRRFIEEHQEPEAHQEPGSQGQASAQPGNRALPEKEPGVHNSLESSQPSDTPPVSEKSDPDKKEGPAKLSPSRSLQFLKGVGPERAKLLAQIGLHTVKDLFFYFPRRYEDRSLQSIGELKDGELASVAGKVVAGQIARGKLKVVKLSIEQDGRLVY